MGKAIMIVGTSSDSGKSTIATALCRIFTDQGLKVAPFKSQNMSLNSYVTKEGEEIGRSQALQAKAARVEPNVRFNPVLLKPKGGNQSQIVLMGKSFADYDYHDYSSRYVPQLIPYITSALDELLAENDLVIIEGAGSPTEINLLQSDISNLFVAKYIHCPAILVGDIDRGGVFASLYGTVKLLPQPDQQSIKAFLINKFRGDPLLLTSGITQLEQLLRIHCLGIVPFISDLRLPAEDAMDLKDGESVEGLSIKIIQLPKISNFTDFEPLGYEPAVHLIYCTNPNQLTDADVVFIPGTKNTIEDLDWMRSKGFDVKIEELVQNHVVIFGMCGGFQMLGTEIRDEAIESTEYKTYPGLGLLQVITQFEEYTKITQQITAKVINFPESDANSVKGYEIHMGCIQNESQELPFLKYSDPSHENQSCLSAMSANKQIFGTFLHGIWENDKFRRGFLKYIADFRNKSLSADFSSNYENIIESNIVQMASAVENSLDIPALMKIIGL